MLSGRLYNVAVEFEKKKDSSPFSVWSRVLTVVLIIMYFCLSVLTLQREFDLFLSGFRNR